MQLKLSIESAIRSTNPSDKITTTIVKEGFIDRKDIQDAISQLEELLASLNLK